MRRYLVVLAMAAAGALTMNLLNAAANVATKLQTAHAARVAE